MTPFRAVLRRNGRPVAAPRTARQPQRYLLGLTADGQVWTWDAAGTDWRDTTTGRTMRRRLRR